MALSIYNNVASIGAQKYLNIASNGQAKSLQRLSSGLRINNAADDASGLAISEKLRGQISGLKRASMNAQDGISYLQTAEGAMDSVTQMLQRMRELAVQAGNGIYTTNDREMLQLEVDQLKDEINRISRSSEFNTKKLLDGSATALWSSSEKWLGALVKGPEVAEGNYKVDTVVTPGQNNVYKTQIMQVNDGVLVSEVMGAREGLNDNDLRLNASMNSVVNPNDLPIVTNNNYYEVTVMGEVTGADITDKVEDHIMSALQTYHNNGSNWLVGTAAWTAEDNIMSGYVEAEVVSTNGGQVSAGFTVRYRYMDAKTGELSGWAEVASTIPANDTETATLTLNVGMKADGTKGASTMELTFPSNAIIQPGDKFVTVFDPEVADHAADDATSGAGTFQIQRQTTTANDSVLTSPFFDYPTAGGLVKSDNGDAKIDYNDIKVNMAHLDRETGVVSYGSMTLQFKEGAPSANTKTAGALISGTTTVNIRDNGPATKDTRLSDIIEFTNADGVSILKNTQEIKVYSKGQYETLYLEADDTIQDFDNKLTAALLKLGLGTDGRTAAGAQVNESLVRYVSKEGLTASDSFKATANSNESVAGTFIIQAAALGDDSELIFTGDQNIMNALGLATIQNGYNSSIDVKVTDAHSGKFVGRDIVNDGKARSIIDGIDITLKQDAGIETRWNDSTKKFEFVKTNEIASGYLHVVDNRTELQIGANEGQTLNISVGQLDTTGLEIDDVYVMDMEVAQRSITKLDKAIEKINGNRAVIGAQMNRLEYTISNLETTRENLVASESRIRDLDIAEETTNLTKQQILVQSATSMVAQANRVPQQALALIQNL